MSSVVVATTEADARAAQAVEQHHAELAAGLAVLVQRVVDAAAAGNPSAAEQARRRLVEFCERELLPHAKAEEQVLYPAARDDVRGRLLIDGMLAEHRVLIDLVTELRAAPADAPVAAAATANALLVLFRSHLDKENRLVLPLLAAAPDIALADILAGMHDLLGVPGSEDVQPAVAGCGGGCGCGGGGAAEEQELDVRAVPHAIRHATVLGALGAVPAGGDLLLVAPHDPKPLLAEIAERWPGGFAVEYVERGPEAWRLKLTRGAA